MRFAGCLYEEIKLIIMKIVSWELMGSNPGFLFALSVATVHRREKE